MGSGIMRATFCVGVQVLACGLGLSGLFFKTPFVPLNYPWFSFISQHLRKLINNPKETWLTQSDIAPSKVKGGCVYRLEAD
jgi:hypothetical protein